MITRPQKLLLAAAVLACIAAPLYFTRLGSNLICYVIFADYYEVPDQSSVFTFRPIDWFKEGSGEWWTYGEDHQNFYFWERDDRGRMHHISKQDAAAIAGFSPTDFKTWKP